MAGRTGKARVAAKPLSPREARRQQRIDLSREQILDTAERLFSERGYHDTGLKEVAELCEFSVGSIYSFFQSKDHLYEEVLMRRGPAQVAEMRRIVADEAPATERLAAMARLQINHFRRYPAWGRLTTRALTVGMPQAGALPAAFDKAYRDAIDIEVALFVDGQREGVLREGDPRALARLFSSVVTAFHGMDPEVGDDAADLGVEEFLAFVVRAFARD
ncbi:MAG TPA: helix-turn-helix domain-containing protein [Pseudonocardiaceae bacterium]|jgi:AcrR family transcriptional regulator|nr:helix-turn-helix domain-containing protein [Pseudonocardiaceae bacterium]